jgi:hypothetical protein
LSSCAARIAHQGEVVRYQPRLDAELLPHRLRVPDLLRPAVYLHDAVFDDALGEILVRCPNADLLHGRIRGRDPRRRGEGIVRLQLHHRPGGNAHRNQRLFELRELGEQRRLDSFAGLVPRPQLVAEGLDDMVGGNTHVSLALLDQLQHRLQHADYGAVRPVPAFGEAAQAVEVAEELIGAVDEVDDHVA